MPKKELALLILLAIIQFTHVTDFMIMMPLNPEFIEAWGISSPEFNLLVGSYALGAVFAAIFGVLFLNNLPKRRTFLLAYLGFVLGTAGCGFAPEFWSFLGFRILSGFFGGLLSALLLALIGDHVPNERRARGIGIVMFGFSLAAIFGVPLGTFLANKFNYKIPFYSLAAFSGLLSIALLYLLPAEKPLNKINYLRWSERLTPFKTLIKEKNQYLSLLTMGFLVIGQFTMIQFISQYLVFNLNYPKEHLPWIYIIGGIAGAISSPIIGFLADKYGRYQVLRISLIVSCLPILYITHMREASEMECIIMTSGLFLVMGGRMIPITTMITSAVSPEKRGGFMGMNVLARQFFTLLATITGAILVGNGTNHSITGFEYTGYLAAITSLLAIPLAKQIKIADN